MAQDRSVSKSPDDAEHNDNHNVSIIPPMVAINVYYGSLPKYSREPEIPYFRFLVSLKHSGYVNNLEVE